MDELWQRLENFLQKNAPPLYAGLAPEATEEQIAATEQTIGFLLPADVRQSYLRHDGQTQNENYYPTGCTFIPCYFELLPVSRLALEWQDNISLLEEGGIRDLNLSKSIDSRVKTSFLDASWVPFAADIGGNRLCLDFDPAPDGVSGQIVEFDHEADGQRCLAPVSGAGCRGLLTTWKQAAWSGTMN